MDNFWVFLEAMAGIPEKSVLHNAPIDQLRRELLNMSEAEREKMAEHLNTVAGGIAELATLDGEEYRLRTD